MDYFKGKNAILATKHKKEKVIAPVLKKELGLEVFVPGDLDTDKFGTFTREKKRVGTQKEALVKKIKYAMKQTGAAIGVGSEGSFGADPANPFLNLDLEMVCLLDSENDLEVFGVFQTNETNLASERVKNIEQASSFAENIGFPSHGIILRPSGRLPFFIKKGFQSNDELNTSIVKYLRFPFLSSVLLETDMRANFNPTRMRAIKKAAENLVQVCKARCPNCSLPGFSVVVVENGLECENCGSPTRLAKAEIFKCSSCKYTLKKHVKVKRADPKYCNLCNP